MMTENPLRDDERLEIGIANRMEEIPRVHEAIAAFVERQGVDVHTRRQLNVVFDELLNNTISYRYEDRDEHTIVLTAIVRSDRLYVTIRDDGKPFNPLDRKQADTRLSVKDRPVGGLGVHLVCSVMDRVAYERQGSTNVVLLEKQLDRAGE